MRQTFIIGLLALGAFLIPASARGDRFFGRSFVSNGSTYCTPYVSSYSTPYYSTPVYTTPVVATPTYDQAPAVPAYNADWKTQVLKYAQAKDDILLYQQTLKTLGIQYQPSYQPGYASTIATDTYGAQGNTIYGYTYQTVKQAYGDLDMNALYQQAARQGQSAQQATTQANTEFSALVQLAGDNQARVAEILAKGKAAEVALNATNPQASTRTTATFQSNVAQSTQPAQDGQPQAQFAPRAASAAALAKRAESCGACHSGNKTKGNFDIAQWDQKHSLVMERLLTDEPETHMPRLPDGRPAKLPASRIADLLMAR